MTPATHHLVNAATVARLKPGALLINTSRGGLVDTDAAIAALKSGQLRSVTEYARGEPMSNEIRAA